MASVAIPHTLIEISISFLTSLIQRNKLKFIALCECSAETLRRAHRIHPITCIQTEYSLWSRSIEHDILPTCAELGVGLVVYAPLGRGFFAGTAGHPPFRDDDYRNQLPRMSGEAGLKNRRFLDQLERIANRKDVTTARLALAWVLKQPWRLGGAGLVPIPGTSNEEHLRENVGAVLVELSEEEMKEVEEAVPEEEVWGKRSGGGLKGWEQERNRELTEEEAELICLWGDEDG